MQRRLVESWAAWRTRALAASLVSMAVMGIDFLIVDLKSG
jgi:hypothetical protein